MSQPRVVNAPEGGFGRSDFDLLRHLGSRGELDHGPLPALEALWTKAERLVGLLGVRLFGEGDHSTALWPDATEDERGPFLWARLKRGPQQRFASHLGVFLSPTFCNLAVDLEKDPLDAGEAAETLEQVLSFYRERLPALVSEPERPDMVVWTDTRNVVPAADFAGIDFGAFMAENRDAGHPWPKVGYLLSPDDVVGFGDRWVGECAARGRPLVTLYDAMIHSFGS